LDLARTSALKHASPGSTWHRSNNTEQTRTCQFLTKNINHHLTRLAMLSKNTNISNQKQKSTAKLRNFATENEQPHAVGGARGMKTGDGVTLTRADDAADDDSDAVEQAHFGLEFDLAAAGLAARGRRLLFVIALVGHRPAGHFRRRHARGAHTSSRLSASCETSVRERRATGIDARRQCSRRGPESCAKAAQGARTPAHSHTH
jgi:hypothetical protein